MRNGRECAPEYIVLRTAPQLESPVLLIIGESEVKSKVTTIIRLDREELIRVNDKILGRLPIVVEKMGRLFSGWVTEDCLVRFEDETRMLLSFSNEEDTESRAEGSGNMEGRSSKEDEYNPFQKHWREVSIFPQLEAKILSMMDSKMLRQATDIKIECSSASGFPVTSFRILRPFGLVRSSTTSVVANILLKLQGLTSIFFSK